MAARRRACRDPRQWRHSGLAKQSLAAGGGYGQKRCSLKGTFHKTLQGKLVKVTISDCDDGLVTAPSTWSSATAIPASSTLATGLDPATSLPRELFLQMLNYLDVKSLLQGSAVSKSWRHASLDPLIWESIYLEEGWSFERRTCHANPSRELGHGACVVDTDWAFLYRQRKRLNMNWQLGRCTKFQLPSVGHPDDGHTGPIHSLRTHGRYLVSGGHDATVRRWDLRSKRLIGKPLLGHLGLVTALDFDPCPHRDLIVSGSSHAELIIWRFSTGERLQKVPSAHERGILCIRYSQHVLVTGSIDGTVKTWKQFLPASVKNAQSYQGMALKGHRGPVTALNVRDNEIVSASADAIVRVWDISTGECLRTLTDPRVVPTIHLDGQSIGGGTSKLTTIIDHATGQTSAHLTNSASLLYVVHGTFDRRGNLERVVSGSRAGLVTVWKKRSEISWIMDRHLNDCGTSTSSKAMNPEQGRSSHKVREHHFNPEISLRTETGTPVDVLAGPTQSTGAYPSNQFVRQSQDSSTEVASETAARVAQRLGPRIQCLQADSRMVLGCSASGSIIEGWDFANGDTDIDLACMHFLG
ncbi:hypothetical protein LTR66_006750 [Elasticomyces elasticus]|nr:hypothetical protein LTR66_006750 [Elasticomyces elasticus]